MSEELLARVPQFAVLATVLCALTVLLGGARWFGLLRRPVLLLATVLALLPPLLVSLAWARWLPEGIARFGRPQLAPWVCVLVLAALLRLLRWPTRMGEPRRTLVELASAIALLGAALAVLGLELGRPLDRLAVVVSIDRSRSMELVPELKSRLELELRAAEASMGERDKIGTLVFGADAAVEDPLRLRSRLPAPQRVDISRDATDLGAALRRALLEVPTDAASRIVLLSDGVNNKGDALEAAAAAAAAGVPIDVIPLDQSRMPDVRVVALRSVPRAAKDETIPLRVVTESTEDADVELRIFRDGELVRRGDVKVRAGEDVLVLREKADQTGLHRWDVELTAKRPAQDGAGEDNSGTAFVRVRGEASVLVLHGQPERGQPLASALERAGFRVALRGPTEIPADLAGYALYDLVVLADIAAPAMQPSQIAQLATYVRDLGGGLLLVGGDKAFGPGGWAKTPIEEVSPVSFDLKQERRRGSLAEIIAIDYSGSMGATVGGHTKLELANEAAARSAELLGAGDRLGVMHVDTVVQWTVPLGPVTDPRAIGKKITAVGVGGGGILVDLTLKDAYAALDRETVNLKHVLLFADGSDAEDRTAAPALVDAAFKRGITTTVIALGKGPDVPDLETMSRLGHGRFYLVEDATRLPAVFAQETILAARSAVIEEPFRARPGMPSPVLAGVDLTQAPPLGGYVVTIAKGRAQTLLRGPEDDPLLATWSVGIGRAGAFTSDLDRWGAEWTRWPEAGRLFAQLARDLARREDDPKVRLEAETVGGELAVRATVIDDDGRAASFRRLRARVAGPNGVEQEVTLEATAAGTYSASVPLSRPGAYVVTALDDAEGTAVATAGAALSAGLELRPTGTDRALLTRIAELSGGKVRDSMMGLFLERGAPRFAFDPLETPLLLVAAFALLLAVAMRRLSLPDAVRRALGSLSERLRRRPAPVVASAPSALALRDAARAEKERAAAAAAVAAAPQRAAPTAQRAAPVAARAASPKPGAAATTGNADAPPASRRLGRPAAGPATRQKSAAELLLEKRRGKR